MFINSARSWSLKSRERGTEVLEKNLRIAGDGDVYDFTY